MDKQANMQEARELMKLLKGLSEKEQEAVYLLIKGAAALAGRGIFE